MFDIRKNNNNSVNGNSVIENTIKQQRSKNIFD